jgi:hypothetical protein
MFWPEIRVDARKTGGGLIQGYSRGVTCVIAFPDGQEV